MKCADGEPPMLHGDGITDDTDAVQWYVDNDVQLPRGRSYAVNFALLRVTGPGFFACGEVDAR